MIAYISYTFQCVYVADIRRWFTVSITTLANVDGQQVLMADCVTLWKDMAMLHEDTVPPKKKRIDKNRSTGKDSTWFNSQNIIPKI